MERRQSKCGKAHRDQADLNPRLAGCKAYALTIGPKGNPPLLK